MKKIIRLTESDLTRIVKRVISESPDPKLDFILTDQEKVCMESYFKNEPTERRDYRYGWLTSEDGKYIHFGVVDYSSRLKNYCKFEINNRPINFEGGSGAFNWNKDTDVITFMNASF